MKIFDPSFDITPVAYSIAYILNTYDLDIPNDISVTTSPFYNCRERNICLTIRGYGKNKMVKSFHIIFGEYRNSDEIVVMEVKKEYLGINPLSIHDMKENDWDYRFFPPSDIYGAVSHIIFKIDCALSYFKE